MSCTTTAKSRGLLSNRTRKRILVVADRNTLTVVNSGNVLPPAVDKLEAWAISVQDGGEGLLVDIAHSWCQTCGWRRACQQTAQEEPRAGHASLFHTKYSVPSVGVPSEVEDVGVIGRYYGQSVVDAGHEVCPADGSVHFHSLIQSLLGLAFVVSVVDASP